MIAGLAGNGYYDSSNRWNMHPDRGRAASETILQSTNLTISCTVAMRENQCTLVV